MFDHADLSIGGCGVQGGVTLLILTRHFRSMADKQGHDIQVAFMDKAAKNTGNLVRII